MATTACLPEREESKETPNRTEDTTFAVGDTKSATKAQRGAKTAPKRCKTEDSSTTQANTEVARPDSAHVKGRRGYLELMTEIPLDTLHEIFRKLEPVDLLRLSWANKRLHAIVMGKSARYIWQEAFENSYVSENPPPPCPVDLNLAQYAHFLFTRKCMECQTGGKCWTSWAMRLRVCWNCLLSERFTNSAIGYYNFAAYFPVIVAKKQVFCLTRDYNEFKGDVGWSDLHARRAQRETRGEGSNLFERWERNRRNERDGELDQLRLARRVAIFIKLAEIGWTEPEVQEITRGKIDKLPGFMRAKKLTPKDWEALRPELIKRLQELKAAQIENEKVVKITHHWRSFQKQFRCWQKTRDPCLLPNPIDLAFREPFKSAIFTPGEEDVEFSIDDLDRVDKEWNETRNQTILSMLPENYSSQIFKTSGSELPLLAALVFRMVKRVGEKGTSVYNTIDMICRWRTTLFSQNAPEGSASSEDLEISALINRHPRPWVIGNTRPWLWDHKIIEFCPEAHELAKDMLVLLKLDPYTTTTLHMWGRKERFICTCCKAKKMQWWPAIEHELLNHYRQRKANITANKRWKVVMDKS